MIDPNELRPRKMWYWIGSGLLTLGLLGGGGGCAVSLAQALALPEFATEFGDAEESSFAVTQGDIDDPHQTWLLYTETGGESGEFSCDLDGPGNVTLRDAPYEHYLSWGNTYWELAGELRLDVAGEYSITCDSQKDWTYGLAYADDLSGFAKGFGMIMLTGVLPTFIGLASGLTIILVTLNRRGRHKAQLFMERGGPYGMPPTPGWGV